MNKQLRFFWNQWYSNHRHQGRLAVMRCLRGTQAVNSLTCLDQPSNIKPTITSLTFSVFPKLTALWSHYFRKAIGTYQVRTIIGDCSGGFQPLSKHERLIVYPYINIEHAKKLDIFMGKLCHSEYVIICDDDVFWLNDKPLAYALIAFEENPNLAVVSLMPRPSEVPEHITQHVDQLMGSYCLVIKQAVWRKENLSFAIKPYPTEAKSGWYYDTADYANIELTRKGYEVIIAPENIRSNLVSFEGISSWLMKIQKHRGKIANNIHGIQIRKEKCFRAILVAEGLSSMVHNGSYYKDNNVIKQTYLDCAKSICKNSMTTADCTFIDHQVRQQLTIINSSYPPRTQTKTTIKNQ